MEKKQGRDKILFITAMLIFGTIGIFRTNIALSSALLAFIRGIIGSAFLFGFILIRRLRGSYGFDRAGVRNYLPKILFIGAAIGINWILLFEAYRYTTVSSATLCYYTAPIIVIAASHFLFREALGARKLVCVILSVIGMLLVSGVIGGADVGIKGILFGLGAAVFYALVILLSKTVGAVEPCSKCAVQLLTGALVLIPYILLTEDFSAIALDAGTVLLSLSVGVIHTGIAYALYFAALAGLRGQTAALFSYIDPVTAVILSALFTGGSFTLYDGIGAVLIIGSALLSGIE